MLSVITPDMRTSLRIQGSPKCIRSWLRAALVIAPPSTFRARDCRSGVPPVRRRRERGTARYPPGFPRSGTRSTTRACHTPRVLSPRREAMIRAGRTAAGRSPERLAVEAAVKIRSQSFLSDHGYCSSRRLRRRQSFQLGYFSSRASMLLPRTGCSVRSGE